MKETKKTQQTFILTLISLILLTSCSSEDSPKSFTLPIYANTGVENVTAYGATITSELTNIDRLKLQEIGMVYANHVQATIKDTKVMNQLPNSVDKEGIYVTFRKVSYILDNLLPQETYYARPYFIWNTKVYYGPEESFTTIAEKIISFTPEQAKLRIGETLEVTIQPENGNYSIAFEDPANANIVSTTVQKNIISIKGVKAGNGRLIVIDKNRPKYKGRAIEIEISKAIPEVNVAQTNIMFEVGQSIQIPIIAGSGNYTVTSANEKIATAAISGGKVVIKGIATGKTVVIIEDVESHKTKSIEVTVNKQLLTIYKGKIVRCNNNNIPAGGHVVIPDGIISIAGNAFYGCSNLKTIDIPNGVKSIGIAAFDDCNSLTSIEIPNSVESIGACAFRNCRSLTSIEIPDGVKSIENATFKICSSLKSIKIPNSVNSIGEDAFHRCNSLKAIKLPNGVTKIGLSAFEACIGLTSINIPEGVTKIDELAFCNCSALISIKIPDTVTSIEESAFEGCTNLISVNIADGVSSIGGYAFRLCSNLTSVRIPNSVSSVGRSAFAHCRRLTSINVYRVYDNESDWGVEASVIKHQ